MLQWKSNRAAFTLIELLVVVIIVAVLAAVGIPLLSAAVERSKVSELEAGLGTIRTAMRAFYSEQGPVVGWSGLAGGGTMTALAPTIGLDTTDLDGRYAAQIEYALVPGADETSYCASVTPTGTAPAFKGAEIAGVLRSIWGCVGTSCTAAKSDGSLFDNATCAGTAIN